MDPALPPGGLDQIFRQYDAIRTHSTGERQQQAEPDEPPPWEPEEERQQAALAAPQAQGKAASKPSAQPPAAPTEITGFITPTNGDGRVTVDGPAPPQKVLTDATKTRPRGIPKSWQEDEETKRREAVGAQNMQFAIDHPNRGTFQADKEGLDKAYGDATYPGVYYDPKTRTMYVKGTVPNKASDWWDDVSKIPVWGDIHNADRMKMAEAAYEELTKAGKPVDRVVGHSLGGSVALQLQKDKQIPLSRTFGAPVFDLNPFQKDPERYRHPKDIFSILDRGATNTQSESLNYHEFGGFSNNVSYGGKFLGD